MSLVCEHLPLDASWAGEGTSSGFRIHSCVIIFFVINIGVKNQLGLEGLKGKIIRAKSGVAGGLALRRNKRMLR